MNPVEARIDPDDTTLTVGECLAFTLTGEDAYGNTYDVTDDAATTFAISGPDEMDGNEYCAETLGEWTVVGTYLTESDGATVTVDEMRPWVFLPFIAVKYTP
jgi:hypothetical protein